MSNEKRKMNGFSIASIVLWAVILILVIVIIVEVIGILGSGDKNDGSAQTNAPSSQTSETILNSDQSGNTDNSTAGQPDNTEPSTPIQTPSNNDSLVNPDDPTIPDGPATDISSADIKDPAAIDYSFLANKSSDNFEDCPEGSFDWYPGKVERSASGEVTYVWDRYKSTLDILDANGGIYRKNTDQNVVYLTFDCGYEYGYTTKILDTLKEKNVKAIFFVTGGFVNDSSNHDLLKRMYNEGHLIGNHTENHKIMPKLSNEEFVSELNSVYKKCKEILGDDFKMSYYRPPQGASSERDLALASYLGYNTVFWSVTHADFNVDNQPAEDVALGTIKGALHPGAVYLLHAVSSTNAAILGDFIDYCISEGFTFRRIDK